MRAQAVILSLVILVSLLITRNLQDVEPRPAVARPSFLEELSFNLAMKTKTTGENISQTVGAASSLSKGPVHRSVTWEWGKIDKNLLNLKQWVAGKTGIFLTQSNADNIGENQPDVSIPEEIINFSLRECNQKIKEVAFASRSILVKYLKYNHRLFEFNPDRRWPIASVTKLMTALITAEEIGMDAKVVVIEKAVAQEGSTNGFQAGEVFRAEDLIKAMLLNSSNDAAMALAMHYSKADFVSEMQKKATELKMFDTSFFDASGLSFLNQSTVNDLAKLTYYIYQRHPEIFEISQSQNAQITELKSGRKRTISSINAFAGQPDFVGGKSGYIQVAGRNLLTIINDDQGQLILLIVLGAQDSVNETNQLIKLCL